MSIQWMRTKPASWVSAAVLAVGTLGTATLAQAQAQACMAVSPPVLNYSIGNAGAIGKVSLDGRVAMMALPNDAPESAAAEVALFNPINGAFTYLTSGTPSVVDIFGERQRFTKRVSAISRDGNLIAISGSSFIAFPFLQLPGNPAPTQVQELVGIPGPPELINVQTGTRQVIAGALGSIPLQANQVRLAQVSGISRSSGKLLLDEQILQLNPTVIEGRTRLLIDFSVPLPIASTLVDIASGQALADVRQAIFNRVGGGFPFLLSDSFNTRLSGNGNAVVFSSNRDVLTPGFPFWNALTAGGAAIGQMPYVYFIAEDIVLPVVDINRTQTRLGGSPAVFLRNVGFSGTVFGLDRGASYIGAPPNPSGAATPATLILGQVPQYVTPPPAQAPARGFFANNFALIAPEEDRVYFSHTADLVPGGNPHQSQELYSIDVSTRQIRQISRDTDTLTLRFAGEPNLIFQYGDRTQLVYSGSSADHRVITYTNTQPGIFVRHVKEIDANGNVILRAARFGTAEYPASLSQRIMVCP